MANLLEQIKLAGLGGAANNFGSPFTPGINPAAPNPQQQGKPNALDTFLGRPGGMFLMNLLAQQGFSTMPQSPLAAVGRAGLMTQQQKAQQSQSDLQRKLIESQVGLNRAKSVGELGTGGGKPLTDLAKLEADFQAGRVPEQVYTAKRNQLLNEAVQERFKNTQSLRGEFQRSVDNTAKSLQSLNSAATLIQTADNPIADLAGFISTIKAIDNSTVREGELNAFQNVQGLTTQLENLLSRAQGKGFSPELRRDIAETINKLRSPLERVLKSQKQFFAEEAGKFNLDPQSIVGAVALQTADIDLSQFQNDEGEFKKPPPPDEDDDDIPSI